jgi:Tol biopolymer transport system component/DNA-binding winged helix-turn-helix (wHTH) protein
MGNAVKHLLEFGPYRVDSDQRILTRGEEPIPLSPKAFDLLLALLERNGQVVLKDDLMKLLWPNTFVEESNLGQHVFQLRKALGEKAQDSSYIVTVPGRGYRFAQTVRALPLVDDIVVESRSRSRVVIEEKIGGNQVHESTDFALFPGRELIALPASSEAIRWHRRRIVLFIFAFLGALIGGLAVWAFSRPLPLPKVVRSVQLTRFGAVEPYGQALTDGSRVYFAQRTGGTSTLAQVSEQGGYPLQIATSVNSVGLYDIDRRRSRLLVMSERSDADSGSPLWVVPTSGGSGRRVGDVLADDAVWSPDGQRIVYSLTTELFSVGDDGSQRRKLFSAPGHIEYLRWSPNGQRISFTVRDVAGVLTLWEIAPDGSTPHPLSFGWKAPQKIWGEGECCGDWSPDGRFFLFRSERDRVDSVWVIRTDQDWLHRGRNIPVQLYTTADRLNEPRFSADGKKIIFVNSQERRELVRFDSEKKQFVPYLGGIPARHISFSRDGKWVAYKNQHDLTLWRSRVDGTGAQQLTFPPLDTYHPSWSPDGKRIAFEGSGTLYMIPFEGGNPERLLSDDIKSGQPSWSPDGNSLLFTRWLEWNVPSIYLMNLSTHRFAMIPDSENFEGPQWSPDGKYMAASDRKDQKLMLYDFSSHQWAPLSDGTPYGWGIRWSNDSKYIYYQHNHGEEEQPIYRVRISDRKVDQLTSSRQILRADVLSYSMTGLTPDNSPLASFLRRNSDIYALELDLP